MDIFIDNRSEELLDVEKIGTLAGFILSREQAPQNVELSISYVGVDEIRELNRSYRGIDAPTDVLSFECDTDEDWQAEALNASSAAQRGLSEQAMLPPANLLGDVIICPDIAREHAEDFDSPFEHEMALMLTHGILHLLGYDHLEDDEATAMETKENALLAEWFEEKR